MNKKVFKILVSAAFISLSISPSAFAGQWKHDGKGWWFEEGGTYARNKWMQDKDGKWYHFNPDGYMNTEWFKDGAYWYYLGGDGAMKTGWISDGGKYYYLDTADGHMLTDTATPDGYKVGSDGSWIMQEASAALPEYYKYFQDNNILPISGDYDESKHYEFVYVNANSHHFIDKGSYYLVPNWELRGSVFYDYEPKTSEKGYYYAQSSNNKWGKYEENCAAEGPVENYRLYYGDLYIDKNAVVYSLYFPHTGNPGTLRKTPVQYFIQNNSLGLGYLYIKTLDERGFVTEFVLREWS